VTVGLRSRRRSNAGQLMITLMRDLGAARRWSPGSTGVSYGQIVAPDGWLGDG